MMKKLVIQKPDKKDIVLSGLSIAAFIGLILLTSNFNKFLDYILSFNKLVDGGMLSTSISLILPISFLIALFFVSFLNIKNTALKSVISFILSVLVVVTFLLFTADPTSLLYGIFLLSVSITSFPLFYLYKKKYFFSSIITAFMFLIGVYSGYINPTPYIQTFILSPLNSTIYLVSGLYQNQIDYLIDTHIQAFQYGYDYATYLAVNYTQDLRLYNYLSSQKQDAIQLAREEINKSYGSVNNYIQQVIESQISDLVNTNKDLLLFLVVIIYYALLGFILFFSNIFDFFLSLIMSKFVKKEEKECE